MVRITYKPWDEIIIHETIEHSLDDLIKLLSVGAPPGSLGHALLWANGIAFTHEGMPMTADVSREQLLGRVHWSNVRFAPMSEYKDFLLIKETNVRIPIIDVSNNPILKIAAEWMSQQSKLSQEKKEGV